MLHLNKNTQIGQGSERSCYSHPNHTNRCIKLIHKTSTRTAARCAREIRYLKKYKSGSTALELIPNYYGTVETNLGLGFVFEQIKDRNGNCSETLSSYVKKHGANAEVHTLIIDMYQTFLKARALVSDLHPGNLLITDSKSACGNRLVMIDGFGNSDFIKICDYSSFFLKRKLVRKFSRMMTHLDLKTDAIK